MTQRKRELALKQNLLKQNVIVLLSAMALVGPATTVTANVKLELQTLSQEKLSPVGLLARCYAHLTRKKLLPSHPLYQQVRSGQLKAVDACMQIFNSGGLINSGANEGRLRSDTPESRAVLQTLNDFHRTWFPSDEFRTAVPNVNASETRKFHDEGEPALHVTRALFTDGVPFSDIVTASDSVEALRSLGPIPSPVARQGCSLVMEGTNINPRDRTLVADPTSSSDLVVQLGDLLGVRRMSLNSAKSQLNLKTCEFRLGGRPDTSISMIDPNGAAQAVRHQDIKVNASFGGGIIGSQSYLLLNLGGNGSTADGGLRMPRRWSKNVFSDLLCRQLPVIRETDARPFVLRSSQMAPNTPSYRENSSCMSCHASIDPMAGTARNLNFAMVGSDVNSSAPRTSHIVDYPVSRPREVGMVDVDTSFHLRPAHGKFFFRSYDGTLYLDDVLGIADLGRTLADTNDLYACAASRYVHFFTGVRVNLQDIEDPSHQPLSDVEKSYRDQVIKMGLDLKAHQNLQKLVRSIFESDLYQKSSQRELIRSVTAGE